MLVFSIIKYNFNSCRRAACLFKHCILLLVLMLVFKVETLCSLYFLLHRQSHFLYFLKTVFQIVIFHLENVLLPHASSCYKPTKIVRVVSRHDNHKKVMPTLFGS